MRPSDKKRGKNMDAINYNLDPIDVESIIDALKFCQARNYFDSEDEMPRIIKTLEVGLNS
jgi:hypothetical protein